MTELTKKTFKPFLKDKLLLVDFYAPWCMPCQFMLSTLSKLKKKIKEDNHLNFDIAKLNEIYYYIQATKMKLNGRC